MRGPRLAASVVALVAAHSVSAAELITNIEARNITRLDGGWQTIVDPYENGYYDYRLEPLANGFFKNQKPKTKSDRVEYDFDASRRLDVPGDWNTQRPELLLYEGTVWYKKSFDYETLPHTRVFAHFGAVSQRAIVYLNGERLGEHDGGFTPFNFEITDRVKPTGNFLVVKVDNVRRRDGVPTVNTDWWNYGGITGPVSLVEVPETYIADYVVQLRKGSLNEIAGWVRLAGSQLQQQLTIEIPEAGIAHTVAADPEGFASFRFPARVSLWSPEDPKLYDVAVVSETDRVRDSIGFRSVEVEGTEILLNGEPIFLRGVSAHAEAPLRTGRAYSAEDARILLGWVREMGGNFVRLAHYPHSEAMIREADRLGVLVWSEVPVYWTIQWDNPATFDNARQQLSENVIRDRNRASIILWSVGNETPIGSARNSFLTRLVQRVRELDPTRLVTAALEIHYIDDTTLLIDDPLGEQLDVLGCNEYIGWYRGLPEMCQRVRWESAYDKPLVMSEFGGGAAYGYHGDALTRWTEEYQESLYEHQVAMLKRIPFLRGTTPWILMDFRSPRRQLPQIQDFFNRKGLVSERGHKKKAFFVMQRFYTELAAHWQRTAP
ncbi:MAG: glycoside hydrolase family 2 TIM barrel-domain containing protein [Acidobacteriota bacterium]|jgi:beta-glucuronidase